RGAVIRASEIFRQPLSKNTDTDDTKAKDPYWNGVSATSDSADLVCRKNFSMLVTDGYWNDSTDKNGNVINPTLPGKASNKAPAMSATANISQVSQTLPDGRNYS